jgi:hypothetical protein
MSSFKSTFQQLQHQWQGNPRLRLMVMAAVAVAAIAVYQEVGIWAEQKKAESLRALAGVDDIRTLQQQQWWHEQQQVGREALAAIEPLFWQADSIGAAEAQFRDLIRAQAAEQGLDINRLQIASQPDSASGLHQVRAELMGRYDAPSWQKFVSGLARYPQHIQFDYEQINRDNPRRQHYRMGVSAWFMLGGGR